MKGVVLRTKAGCKTLDQYIFADARHAYEWLSQKYITKDDYRVEIATLKMTPCCRRKVIDRRKPVRKLTVSEYLKLYSEGAISL